MDKARLTGLPFVAPAVWDEVMVEGQTPCNFNLRLQLQDHPTIHYRVQCAPDDATVQVEVDRDERGPRGRHGRGG